MNIDSHQHFWKIAYGWYHWMRPEQKVLWRDYLPPDLKPLLDRHGIQKTILVQAAETIAETDFLLSLAQEHDIIGGVVGWLDLASPDFPRQLAHYRQQPKFVGVRPILHDIPQDDWILQPQVVANLKVLAAARLPFDFLVRPRHLPYVLRVLEQVPDLRSVIDHIAKPDIKNRQMEPWKSLIAEVAQHPQVYCKLSGMVTEADHQRWTPEDLRPYVEHVLSCFGFQRVMYGSDWPVCLLAGTYDQVIGALRTVLAPHLDPAREAAVFGENAARFYGLPPR